MASFNFTSGKEVIARFESTYTVDFSDWMADAPLYIFDGLLELGSPVVFEYAKEEIQVANYVGMLPVNIRALRYLEYQGNRLDHLEEAKGKSRNETGFTRDYYTHNNDRTITTSFEEGTITVYFKRIKITAWEEQNVSLPDVPDDIHLFNALADYIMMRLLKRGYKHPMFSLRENNPYLNPAMSWEINSKRARNSLGALTPDERYEISKISRELISNYNYSFTEGVGNLYNK